ncbi:hypothetical protein B0H19DRAFT_596959 [Mycena capillaripes]|nr:hypothetical protein B0H19DRAFT_596959 [Mycena capillaripes]
MPGSSLASKVRPFFCHSPPPRPSIVKTKIAHLGSGRPLLELPTDTTSSNLDRRVREAEASPLWAMLRSIFTRRFADPAEASSNKSSGNSPHKAGPTSSSNGAWSYSPDRGSSLKSCLVWFRHQFRRVKYRAFKNPRPSIACSPLPPVYAYYARMLEFEYTRTSYNSLLCVPFLSLSLWVLGSFGSIVSFSGVCGATRSLSLRSFRLAFFNSPRQPRSSFRVFDTARHPLLLHCDTPILPTTHPRPPPPGRSTATHDHLPSGVRLL